MVKDTAAPTAEARWTANARDADLQLLEETAGNGPDGGLVTTRTFDPDRGFLSTIKAGPANAVANFTYSFDTIGNLTARSDATQSLIESFTAAFAQRAATFGVGEVAGTLGPAATTVAHGTVGGTFAVINGGEFSAGFLAPGFSSAAGPIIDKGGFNDWGNTAAHAAVGGTGSVLGGGKFEDGAITGSFTYLYNGWSHRTCTAVVVVTGNPIMISAAVNRSLHLTPTCQMAR